MKIQDRIKQIKNVVDAIWDGTNNRLVVYYSGSLREMQVLIADAIEKAEMQRAIEIITYIS